ncbi:acyl-CoA dehydrogenase [Mycolicibacterium vanbaalenii]|uniref:acyl-CoA dehydrogenase n=1 Tax=Mycolicibacterium vanbaalenii TaxID=110539 RepID=UPI00132F5AED|nr:acyl-CoA dehydrogenase [Mycolicibacterium vanbaalenii]
MNCLVGGVFTATESTTDDQAELRGLVDDLGRRMALARGASRSVEQRFDAELWRHLVSTGLHRLTSAAELAAGPTESAVVLHGLARHSAPVPIAETDVLGAWLARTAGLSVPDDAPLTVAIAECAGDQHGGNSLAGTATGVPWASDATVLLAVPAGGQLMVTVADVPILSGYNLAGEPRGSLAFDLPRARFTALDMAAAEELNRRGAWARCVQIVGALDTTAALTVAHTRGRSQFGQPLTKFQSVQHSLALLAGEVERARAATTLAVAAAADHGYGSVEADYAVTLAKVTLGQVVPTVTTIAHQLHGAIGVTLEHDLWMSTMRARSWIDEFGSATHHAIRLGRVALAASRKADTPWDVLFGSRFDAWE